MRKVLLGIDFIGSNFPAALYSLDQWWKFIRPDLGPDLDVLVGISNFCDRNQPLPGLPSGGKLTPEEVIRLLAAFIPARQLVQWTSDLDPRLLAALRARGVSANPFYTEFNYGSVVNRQLLLGAAHDCDYVCRIDPGTLPPAGTAFGRLLEAHAQVLAGNPNGVVSRLYDNRLALRHMYVRQDCVEQHLQAVHHATGINVRRQITGGAMLTFKCPGVPALCVPRNTAGPTFVWASDDGLYQQLFTGSENMPFGQHPPQAKDYPVRRFDAEGKSKPPIEYYRGIVGAVALKAFIDGKSRPEIEALVRRFLGYLVPLLDPVRCLAADEEWPRGWPDSVAPTDYLNAIEAGWQNYQQLRGGWQEIGSILRPILAGAARVVSN